MMSQIDGSRLLVKIPAPATGRVVGLASSPLHRFSKSARESFVLLEGLGAEGDVHAGTFVRHRYLARRRPKMPNLRQVHLIPSELFEALRSDGYELRAGDLGENILTAGLDLEGLPLGTILKLGAKAAIELTGLRTPCALIDRFKPGLKRRMLVEERCRPRFRCGVMGVVRSSGRILIGDAIAVRFPARPLKSLPAL
jgi:MOSC domain-containing protein YiiM